MHICIHDFSGHPFQVQLSRELASRGLKVTHLYSKDIVGAKGNLQMSDDDPETLKIRGLSIGHAINRYNFVKRLADERAYGKILAAEILKLKPTIVIVSNTPLDSFIPLAKLCRQSNIRIVFWLQDVLGIAAYSVLRQKLGYLGALIGSYYISREKKLLRQADHIVPISDDFLGKLKQWGVPQDATTVIENWAPIGEMPQHPRENSWSIYYNLSNRKVALYSGALGLKHNPKLLLDLAQNLDKYQPDSRLIVISEGHGADWLKEQNEKLKLKTLVQLPFQPFSELPQVLASGDVLLAILEPEAGEFCVPSKVLSYMCVGRPIVLAASAQNLASNLINQNRAGKVVSPSNSEEFSQAVIQILQDPKLQAKMGENARIYAEQTFDIKRIGDKFETIIQSISRNLVRE